MPTGLAICLALAILILLVRCSLDRGKVRCPSFAQSSSETTATAERGSGFFSNCCCRLGAIIEYYNSKGSLPEVVDSSDSWRWYKPFETAPDVTFEYFMDYRSLPKPATLPQRPVPFDIGRTQFESYATLAFPQLVSFVQLYFSPSAQIRALTAMIEEKYKLSPSDTFCLFHRGNDKVTETAVPDHASYLDRFEAKAAKTPSRSTVVVQSDETEFLETARARLETLGWRVVIFEAEMRHIKSNSSTTVDAEGVAEDRPNSLFSKYFLAITIIMSRCAEVFLATGNCQLWVALLRGKADGVHQWKDGAWL